MRLFGQGIFLVILGIFFLDSGVAKCQTTGEEARAFLNDGGVSETKNVFKFGVASTLSGDASLAYERLFGEKLSLELGAGIILPFVVETITHTLFEEADFVNSRNLGYSFVISPRYKIQVRDRDAIIIGLLYQRRSFGKGHASIKNDSYLATFTSRVFLSKHLSAEFGSGFGWRNNDIFMAQTTFDSEENQGHFEFQIIAKIEYHF